jgi:hypothetical protein
VSAASHNAASAVSIGRAENSPPTRRAKSHSPSEKRAQNEPRAMRRTRAAYTRPSVNRTSPARAIFFGFLFVCPFVFGSFFFVPGEHSRPWTLF